MDALKQLNAIRQSAFKCTTPGLSDAVIQDFLAIDPALKHAIDEAAVAHAKLLREYPEMFKLSEDELIKTLQKGLVNFYADDQTNPYVPLAGRGPWIITSHGAVIHDSGGYGMIGFGHAPDAVLKAMGGVQVMANVMTANFSQKRLVERLTKEIGHARPAGAPKAFSQFICMNSGSESVTVATRISDIWARKMTDPGGKHAGHCTMYLVLKGSFHGRTERPAQASNSSLKKYQENLASFRGQKFAHVIEPNNIAELNQAFAWADKEGVFFEMMFMEPVMGEGDPGKAITPEFYAQARALTKQHGSLLLMDSIQAGIRAHGVLSICDYPGFEQLDPPDMETYSKAVNAGQYPLSILAMTDSAAAIYVRGVYGNTKTTNPRALDVAVAVLDLLTPALRRNIKERGAEFLKRFDELQQEFPDIVTKVQGTGLLCSIDIDPKRFAVIGYGQLEEWLRRQGIGVIHGGVNSLRFTPHFAVTTKEIDLITTMLRRAFKEGPRK